MHLNKLVFLFIMHGYYWLYLCGKTQRLDCPLVVGCRHRSFNAFMLLVVDYP